jgi:hypothetical protein
MTEMEGDMRRSTLPTQTDEDAVVVAARFAWDEYRGNDAYVCKVGRSFRQAKYMVFYSGNEIHSLAPVILNTYPAITFERGRYSGKLGEIVDKLTGTHDRKEGETYQVVLLSSPDDPRTVKLDSPIPNDLKSKNGGRIAFTQYQRYASLADLNRAKTTSDLVRDV